MKNILKYLSFLIILTSLLSTGCREECDDPTDFLCPNYDPCLSLSAADATFIVLDSLIPTRADTSIGFICDTFNTGSRIYFKARNKNMESYQWSVGADQHVWTEPEFNLGFNSFEGTVSVRLVTSIKDIHECFNEEQIYDTTYQVLNLIQGETQPYGAIFGEFHGSDSKNTNQKYTLKVVKEGEDAWHSYRLFGLPNSCSYPIGLGFQSGHNWFVSNHDQIHCRNTIVIGQLLEDNNTLQVDYWFDDDDGNRQHYIFEGVRQ